MLLPNCYQSGAWSPGLGGDRLSSPVRLDPRTGENKAFSSKQRSLAPSVIHDTCRIDPALALVVDAWPTLPPALKAGIIAMVKAARN